jgi:hypothetical protein
LLVFIYYLLVILVCSFATSLALISFGCYLLVYFGCSLLTSLWGYYFFGGIV